MTSIPPGWYPDQNGVTRWWDGTQWTAATQPAPQQPQQWTPPAPEQPAQQQQPAQSAYPTPQGYTPYPAQPGYAQASAYPQVTPGTPGTTVWAWLIALLPAVETLLSLGYTLSLPSAMASFMNGLGGIDPSTPEGAGRLTREMLGAFFNGWYFALVGIGLVLYALTVVFAALDHRELGRRGYVRPFHWAWAFLGPIVYLIGRTVVVHRRGGRSLGPLWAMIAVTVGSFVISWITGAIISTQLAQFMTDFVGVYGYTN